MDCKETGLTKCSASNGNKYVSVYRADAKRVVPGRRKTAGIHKCVLMSDYDALKRILSSKKRDSINDCDHFGRTALHIAMQMADPKSLYLLLYYPLVHPSKLFATQDLDFMLSTNLVEGETDANIDVICDCNTSDVEGDNGSDKGDIAKPETRLSRFPGKFRLVSNGIVKKTSKKTTKDECHPRKCKKVASSWHIGPYLLRHWERSPESYLQSVLGVDNAQHILGCGMKEVETLYQEHYKFLAGEPHDLNNAVRNYSSKYAKIYSNHPLNYPFTTELLQGHAKLYTKVDVKIDTQSNLRSTSISTYESEHLGELFVTSKDFNFNNEDLYKERNHPNQRDADVETTHVGAANSNCSSKMKEIEPIPRKIQLNQLRMGSLPGNHVSRMPLVICDLVATYDKTPPIHLLFSNIHIESYRENIYRCFRILLHYFNTFRDAACGFNLCENTMCDYYGTVKRFFEPFEKHQIRTPRMDSTPVETPLLQHTTSPCLTPRMHDIACCAIADFNPAAAHTTKSTETGETTYKRQRKDIYANVDPDDLGNGPHTRLKRTALEKDDCGSDSGVERSQNDFIKCPVTIINEAIQCTKEVRQSNPAIDSTRTVKGDIRTDDAVYGAETRKEQNDVSIHSFEDTIPCDHKQSKDMPMSSRDNRRPHYNITNTLCADVSSMKEDVAARRFSAIRGIRRGAWKNKHQKFFQLPLKHGDCALNIKYFSSESLDPKLHLLGEAIVSSIGWLKPQLPWDTFLNTRDYTRSNLLHKVCQLKDVDLIKWLLGSGCHPLVVNEVGDLPVHLTMDTKDPMCVLTMIRATFSALFHHQLGMAGIDTTSRVEQFSSKTYNAFRCGEDSLFETFMNGLNTNTQYDQYSSVPCISSTRASCPRETTCEERHADGVCPVCHLSHAATSRSGIEDSRVMPSHERVILFEEMISLMEQLTYRGIKAWGWEALIAMFSYNETLTQHLLSSPHYMHRFINMAVLMGNSDEFMAVVNFLASTGLKVDNLTPHAIASKTNVDCSENEDADGLIVTEEWVQQTENNSAVNNIMTSLETVVEHSPQYKGFGLPSLPLNRLVKSTTVSQPDYAGTSSTKCSSSSRVESVLEHFRGKLIVCPQSSIVSVNRAKSPPKAHNTETWIITHPTCLHHLALPEPTDAPNRRHRLIMSYPENPTRLEVIISNENGILRSDTLENVKLLHSPPPATLSDILRVHDWDYIDSLLKKVQLAQNRWIGNIYWPVLADGDTPATPHSWNSALYAAGSVIAAVDAVCSGDCRNAFCAVRPPGHHLGTWGGAQSAEFEDEDFAAGSQGFCLINNVAVGAAYAKYMYAKKGIRRIAIIDFDIHHGNGTHQIVLNIGPRNVRCRHAPNSTGTDPKSGRHNHALWFGWNDTNDREEVLFSSIHAYDGLFYPGTGKTCVRYNEAEPRIINIGLPEGTTSAEFRVLFETRILPYLLHFKPDLIFLSAGFDGHYRDSVSSGFVKYKEKDFYWATERLVAVANAVCNGRVVSVLEGGYNTRLDTLSPFAKSVFEHVKALSSTRQSYVYPLMHAQKTIDLLLAPLVCPSSTPTHSDISEAQSVDVDISTALYRAAFIRESTDQLLIKAYGMGGLRYCSVPMATSVIPKHTLKIEALARTGNPFFSFYSRNFQSLFITGNYAGCADYMCRVRRRATIEHDVMTFDKLMGNDPTVVSTGKCSSDTVIASDFTLQATASVTNDAIERLLLSNAWSMDIKMKSLERHATTAALLWAFFQRFGHVFKWPCDLHF
ncbi:Type-2 histone deacetylase 2 [Babesia sp. Xinjiang]|uniref:Type-2 histone deacetylase 2 n=1 Tax=Babesia sp. Xinjiang TaxID=462227 RepID=UPI000A258E2A|nr:Type-2 histone deacetylase 2 [Babesia sp. Xinjiang]ORM41270.1 Type-2 histone deacetylase 2 [Babesia sp. Xinjiang]